MNLPDHIIKKSDVWYQNTKTGKFIHLSKIEAFCDRYWANRKGTKRAAISYKKNVKMAHRRWNDE